MSGEDREVQNEVKSFIDRIRRMKAERKAIDVDIREIYAEAKSRGFDKTILGKAVNYVEKREEDPNAVAESEAILDLYIGAYYGAGTDVATHTHEAKKSEPQLAPQAGSDPVVPQGPQGRVADIQPETVEQSAEPETASATDGGQELSVSSAPDGAIESEDSASDAGQAPSDIAGSSNGRTAPFDGVNAGSTPAPASNISAFKPKPLRPNCLKPEACAGSGRNHCWQCTKAMNEAGAA